MQQQFGLFISSSFSIVIFRYQLYNVDVWAVVVVVTVVAVGLASWFFYSIIYVVASCCCRSRKTKKD